ncbi:MAG TPA: hypothetical protein VGG13_00715 [Candidatus Saccharimonadales bacterium]|jgi:hypothetical protein
MNAWRGLRSYDGVLMAIALIFGSAGALAIGSKVDAAISQPVSNETKGAIHAQSGGLALVMKAHDFSMQNSSRVARRRLKAGKNADINKFATVPSTGSNGDGPESTAPSQPAQPVVASVQLTPEQLACQQGQTIVQSAQATLQNPLTNSVTVIWYWETRIDAGTNTSGMSPISDTSNSQSLAAGATTISFTASDSSQPLLSAPANSDYAYSFRLHVLIDGTDTTSAWTSIPQAANCQ